MDFLIFQLDSDPIISQLLSDESKLSMASIIQFAETKAVTTDAVREYVISALANNDNILSQLAQTNKKVGDDLLKSALSDLNIIFSTLSNKNLPTYCPSGNEPDFFYGYIDSIRNLVSITNTDDFLNALIHHYQTLGNGVFAQYSAFKYENGIQGISDRDTITFSSLVGLEYQKQVLIENTKAFLNGHFANNVLLFGDRGTGKSSSVKALLNMFCDDGLRVIELSKQSISALPDLIRILAQKPQKYILFLDDLSFETNDPDYKSLKTSMEGQLQSLPKNVLIYATSNRRHLIRENWSERDGDVVHVNDHMQETLSLSERFGISLVFSAPTQKEYLNIVSELMKEKGYEMNALIEREAIIWQMNYSGRSGRCASQFVTSYISKNKK